MIIIFSTYPDRETAAKEAMDLVEKEFAACVSIIKIDDSVYRWKGKIRAQPEYLIMIKSTHKAYSRIESHIKKNHPHKTPEIIYVEVAGGNKDYIDWVDANSASKLFRVPLDLTTMKRASEPSSELMSAKKPRTLSR